MKHATAHHKFLIRKNHSERRPCDYVFLDVETKEEKIDGTRPYLRHSLRLGVACYVRWERNKEPTEKWFNFEHSVHFWEWVKQWERKKRILWIIAHNASFDLTILGLWSHIETGRYRIERQGKEYVDSRSGDKRLSAKWQGLLAIDGTPFHVETEGIRGRVNFSDLQNYYQLSLGEIAKTVGLEKGDYERVKNDDANLRAYCHTDVEILKRAYLGLVERWEQQHNGNWQFSAASLAYSHYRHKYMDTSIALHNHAEATRIEWQSLYGGEVRCLYRGKAPGKVVHYDVNSLYPSVMLDQTYPTALVDFLLRPSRNVFRSCTARYAAVAEVDIRTDTAVYPVRKDKRIVFPVGKFTTTLAGPELLAALDRGHITHCYSLALYTHAPIFKRYVLEWWHEKQRADRRGDSASKAFSKLMLNSLPAKFAQRTPVWVNDTRVMVVEPWKVFPYRCPATGTIYPARSIGWVGQVMKERVASEHAFPAIYAYVTAYAREYMRQLRSMLAVDGIYYQDTDSLMISEYNAETLEHLTAKVGDGIGQLKHVGTYSEAIFRGPKNYTVDGRHTISGVRKRDVEIADMSWNCQRFERNSAIFTRTPDETIRVHSVDFETHGTNVEGYVRDDGWCEPLELIENSGKYLGIN